MWCDDSSVTCTVKMVMMLKVLMMNAESKVREKVRLLVVLEA